MNDRAYIYALRDPFTNLVRYVGKARHPERRLRQHLGASKTGGAYRDHWIRGVVASGELPTLEILEACSGSEWEQYERDYIRVFKMFGMPLTNLTDGGDGVSPGHKASPETRLRMSRAKTGVRFSEEHKKKLGEAQRGRSCSEETREKIRLAKRGRKLSLTARQNMSAAQRLHPSFLGHKHSEESLAKMRAAHAGYVPWNTGRSHPPETREKIRLSLTGRRGAKHTLEARQKISRGLLAAHQRRKIPRRHGEDGRFLKNL